MVDLLDEKYEMEGSHTTKFTVLGITAKLE